MTTQNSTHIALVTGGSRGIGRSIVDALLRRGSSVALCARSPETVDATALALGRIHDPSRIFARPVDVGNQRQVDDFVAETREYFGHVDCLVNNAGVGYFAPVDELPGEDWRRLVRTNLDGPFYFTHAVAKGMREQGSGLIVNIVSLAGRHSFAGGAAYNATKFGLLGFSDACMLDLRGDGVRVTAVLPGSVDTDFDSPGKTKGGKPHALHPDDVAQAVIGLLDYPERALPSRIELRPTSTS